MENTKKFAPGTKVIIVEDDKLLGSLLSQRLIDEGCAIRLLEDGEQVQVSAETDKPDLILLDLLLPNISGFDILAILKTSSLTKDIPVIILSCLSNGADIKRGLDLGADGFLSKSSITIDGIMAEAHKILQARNK